jgi:hypothetical protein
MQSRMKSALRRICDSEVLEARWLHTLSALEFIGARKISRTVARHHPSRRILEHLADETRHAMAFKDLAAAAFGHEPSSYLCIESAGEYFAKLDNELSAWFSAIRGKEDTSLNYLLVTTLIERRAMKLYPLYRSITTRDDVRDELSVIIREEQAHRLAIEEECLSVLSEYDIPNLSVPEAVESAFFSGFWSALEEHISGLRAAA